MEMLFGNEFCWGEEAIRLGEGGLGEEDAPDSAIMWVDCVELGKCGGEQARKFQSHQANAEEWSLSFLLVM